MHGNPHGHLGICPSRVKTIHSLTRISRPAGASSPVFLKVANYDCIKDLIGLANCACPCLEGDAPTGWNESPTGLFVADLFPVNYFQGLENCGENSIWSFILEARRRAAADTDKDLYAAMMQVGKERRPPFAGVIGQQRARTTKPVSATYAGLRMLCNPLKSANIQITGISAFFDFTGTLTLTIYDGRGNQVGETIELDTLANKARQNVVSIDLPAVSEYGAETYYFVYEVGENNPLYTSTNCGCAGSRFVYNEVWQNSDSRASAWMNWVNVSGWSGDTLTDFDTQTISPSGITDITNGILLHIKATCDTTNVFCDGEADTNRPETQVLAKALQFKAAAHLADLLLVTDKANRFAIINRELLIEWRKEWAAYYADRIRFLAESVNLKDNDCLCTKSGLSISTSKILT